jgi:hypothetical protein
MLRVIIVYLIIMAISFLVGLNIKIDSDKSSLDRETNIENVSLYQGCEGGICPPPEEYKDK